MHIYNKSIQHAMKMSWRFNTNLKRCQLNGCKWSYKNPNKLLITIQKDSNVTKTCHQLKISWGTQRAQGKCLFYVLMWHFEITGHFIFCWPSVLNDYDESKCSRKNIFLKIKLKKFCNTWIKENLCFIEELWTYSVYLH